MALVVLCSDRSNIDRVRKFAWDVFRIKQANPVSHGRKIHLPRGWAGPSEWVVSQRVNRAAVGDDDPALVSPEPTA